MKTRKFKILFSMLLISMIVFSVGIATSFGNTKKALTDAEMGKVYGGDDCMRCCFLGNEGCDTPSGGNCVGQSEPNCTGYEVWYDCTEQVMECHSIAPTPSSCTPKTTPCSKDYLYVPCVWREDPQGDYCGFGDGDLVGCPGSIGDC